MSLYTQDPADVLDYHWDFLDKFGSGGDMAGDSIASATVTATPSDLTVASVFVTATNVTAWLQGGSLGRSYTVACRIATSGGRTYSRSITVDVLKR